MGPVYLAHLEKRGIRCEYVELNVRCSQFKYVNQALRYHGFALFFPEIKLCVGDNDLDFAGQNN